MFSFPWHQKQLQHIVTEVDSSMKCDLCNKPAVVHEVTVKNGQKNEVHLCEDHAAESGIAMPGHQPINQLLTQFVVSPADATQGGTGKKGTQRSSRKVCDGCGMTFAQFRQSGILGCAECYEAFAEQLSILIQRTQGGATHHVGKSPRRAGKSLDRQLERQRLIKQLDAAVDAEQYERAAKLRDMLNMMEVNDGDGSGDSSDESRRS